MLLDKLRQFLQEEFTEKRITVWRTTEAGNALQAVLDNADSTKEAIISAAVSYCQSSPGVWSGDKPIARRTVITEWLKREYPDINVSVVQLDGTETRLSLPRTSTGQDLKVAIEAEKGVLHYMQEIWLPLREDGPLSNDEMIRGLVQDGETLTLHLFIKNSHLQAALDRIRDATSDEDIANIAQDIGMHFDQDTGELGEMLISDFWSGEAPNFEWQGPEGINLGFDAAEIERIKRQFTALNNVLVTRSSR